ncbi:hypothetical protein WMY93_031513 [Mugilogobius chulae]|uniref:Uncharacterized protein n=1 Tax=Mugilogobius chulae TaxID=88201 RepID=A0AAW0MM69_9GOBI
MERELTGVLLSSIFTSNADVLRKSGRLTLTIARQWNLRGGMNGSRPQEVSGVGQRGVNYWRRRSSEQEDPRKGGSGSTPFSKAHSPHTDSDSEVLPGPELLCPVSWPKPVLHPHDTTACAVPALARAISAAEGPRCRPAGSQTQSWLTVCSTIWTHSRGACLLPAPSTPHTHTGSERGAEDVQCKH